MIDAPEHNPSLDTRIAHIDLLAKQWRTLTPMNEDMALAQQTFEEDFLVRMAYNSNAIEGSTLTLPETEVIYEGEFVPGKPGREQVAARGIFEGSDFLDKAIESGRTLDEELLKDLHERCALDLQPRARGIYRSAPAIIRASRTTPVAPLRIRGAMDNLFFHYENAAASIHPLERIPWFHAAFESIHPFAGGNGRTGRLWMNALMRVEGYPPICIKVDHSVEYKTGLEHWQVDGDASPFMKLFLSALEDETRRRIEFLSQGPAPNGGMVSIKHSSEALGLIAANPAITAKHLGEALGLSERQAQRLLRTLQEAGLIKRVGARKNGVWRIMRSDNAE